MTIRGQRIALTYSEYSITDSDCGDVNYKMTKFPSLPDNKSLDLVKIDEPSCKYISNKKDALSITKIIMKNVKEPLDKLTITDATAGVGGNSLSFASKFAHVNSVELDSLRAGYLKSNADTYNFKNITVYNNDYTKIYTELKQDVVFMDPPWGGSDYKTKKNLQFRLGDIRIENLCNKLLEKNLAKYVVLKLPFNYDMKFLYRMLRQYKIKRYKIHKMEIVFITKKQK